MNRREDDIAREDELVTDELELLARHVPLAGARVIELGCGKAEFARRLVDHGEVRSVTALEVDTIQHERNLASPRSPRLRFMAGGADAIPLPDNSFELALMLKSLHHVPIGLMDTALTEIRRVLVPGGHLYVSEPVYAGEFNDLVRLFHDEGTVRAAAYTALQRAIAAGVLEHVHEITFRTPMTFRDFDDFVDKLVRVTYADRTLESDLLEEVRTGFERFMTPSGARFVRPMRVNLLRRPAAT